jgi:hypothetical protein
MVSGIYRRIHSLSNIVYKSYTSLYCLIFFSFLIFPTSIPLVYTEIIFLSVFADGYKYVKFCRKKSLQNTDRKISLVFLFVFANFLVMNQVVFLFLENANGVCTCVCACVCMGIVNPLISFITA